MKSALKRFLKKGFRQFGFDVIRTRNSPLQTLLGLREIPFDTIIDVGANTGQFAKQISTFFPRAKLFCFEPLPEPFSALSSWADSQNGRVTALNLAIGAQDGEIEMFLHENHTPSSSLLSTTKFTEDFYTFTKAQKKVLVRQTTLDAALSTSKVNPSQKILIKLDVQGYEDRVIQGGNETFSEAAACIVEVGLDTLYEGQAQFLQLQIMLDTLGYRYVGNLNQTYGDDGHCMFLDAVFLNKTREGKSQ